MKEIPKKATGFRRVINATGYSLAGCKDVFKKEAAFRQEVVLWLVLNVLLFVLDLPLAIALILFFAHSLLVIVEVINSSIERVVDLSSPNYHKLAKHSKNIASFAVLLSILLIVILWTVVVIHFYL